MTKYEQARSGLTVDAADGIVRVRDGVDTWLADEEAWDLVRLAMDDEAAVEGDEGGADAYSDLCRRVAKISLAVVSGQGRERGHHAQRLAPTRGLAYRRIVPPARDSPRSTQEVTSMSSVIVVTRHPPLVTLLRERGLVGPDVEVLEHVTSPEQIRGRHVYGILPLHLAAVCASVTEIPMTLTREDREAMSGGGHLSLERTREVAGEAVTYVVRTPLELERGGYCAFGPPAQAPANACVLDCCDTNGAPPAERGSDSVYATARR